MKGRDVDKIEFLVVSGFLGAGKTTTMIALAEYMDKNVEKVGIIANDLGAQLVDTNLTRENGCTVEEISSGCICYQMDNTVDKIRRMRDRDGARLVMSDIPGCGVGTVEHVYKQILRDNADEFDLGPLAVIVDPERLRMVMPEQADINLPQELKFLLEQQVEEGDVVVLNKIDTLSDEEIERYLSFLRQSCSVPVLAISAREGTGIPELADFLIHNTTACRHVEIDYAGPDYAQAEAVLTWYNRRLYFKTLDGSEIDYNEVVDDFIEGIRLGLIERKGNVPHLKLYGICDDDYVKASLIGVDYDIEYEHKTEAVHRNLSVIVNARAVCPSRKLARLMDDALDEVCERYDLDAQVFFTECFGMADEGRR